MAHYEELRELVDSDTQIITGDIPKDYLTDVLKRLKGTAEAVIKPDSSEQVAAILKWADKNRILELDSETMTATVEAGVVLEDFQQYVEERGFFYPPDPGEKKAYELGGLTSGEHGIGLSKKEFFLKETNESNLEIMRAIKRSFDPKQLLNGHISYNI